MLFTLLLLLALCIELCRVDVAGVVGVYAVFGGAVVCQVTEVGRGVAVDACGVVVGDVDDNADSVCVDVGYGVVGVCVDVGVADMCVGCVGYSDVGVVYDGVAGCFTYGVIVVVVVGDVIVVGYNVGCGGVVSVVV